MGCEEKQNKKKTRVHLRYLKVINKYFPLIA